MHRRTPSSTLFPYTTLFRSIAATYTVRKIASGVGVERTFPVNDPRVAKIEVLRHGRVRRAKLYYLRERHGKSARIAEKRR